MRRRLYFGVAAILLLSLSGCGGGGGDSRTIFVAQIASDQPADGDIEFDPVLQTFAITNGPNILLFGINGLDPAIDHEFRAFLDFPLDGSTGGDVVPANARIVSATITVFVDDVLFASSVPTLIDLVQYPLSGLRLSDYDSSPLGNVVGNTFFTSADIGFDVTFDVTPLMQEAQLRGFSDFQVRLLLDFSGDIGLVSIEDLPNVAISAPLLTVEYN
ncbi:MAG: hypothetical protein ACXWWV_06295 [Candidatus Deferrimicrobiaceae bacterium]